MLTITGGLINGVQTTMYALAAHVYPAAIRATGVGSAVSFGRIGAVLSGYLGAWALESGGPASFFGVIALMMAMCLIALAIVRRHVEREGKVSTRSTHLKDQRTERTFRTDPLSPDLPRRLRHELQLPSLVVR